MVTRRDFVQAAIATAVLTGASTGLARAAARQAITQADLLRFDPVGQVTLRPVDKESIGENPCTSLTTFSTARKTGIITASTMPMLLTAPFS